MSEPFLGEIRIVSFNYTPRGWAICDGSLLPINQNQALFSLLGTTYGGNGQTNFALPDFRGRVPVHAGNGIGLGIAAGNESHILTISELPSHSHPVRAGGSAAAETSPVGNLWAATTTSSYYPNANTTMSSLAVQPFGGGQPHNNMQPFLVFNFVIALEGIFPSRP
ncbi:phage tail protein [Paenibacillus hamazuiensis]|uniref:phage tail protein n=1 Tax=Paenibacillus hamazuiensis TaxID=2936508 RepID=UPI0020102C9B|nr:tail fiber protein [Paenibacillus hamazuiensis]